MKVLYDYQAYNQLVGGVSRYHIELIKALPREGVVPQMPYLFSDNLYLVESQIKHGYFGRQIKSRLRQNIYKWLNQKISLKELHSGDYNVFHPTFLNPYYVGHTQGKPVVVTIHDLIHEKEERFDSVNVAAKRKKVVQNAQAIIAISEQTKEDLMYYYNVKEENVSVIYHGVEQNLVNCANPSLYKFPFLLYIGNRSFHKNFTTFIHAFSKLDKNIHLVCTGSSFSKEEGELLLSLGIAERVHQQFVSDEDLQNLLCNAIAFVYPSKMEGFGLPILEAFRCSCPCIISDIPCFHEVAGEAALYFDPCEVESIVDIINKTIYDDDRLNQMKKMGKTRLPLFTWQQTAKQTANIYKSLC